MLRAPRMPHTDVHGVTRPLVIAVLSLLLVLGMVAPAGATTAFKFTGRGWGHGVGMSQYGALELARDGRSAGQIISHYYQGASATARDLGLGAVLVGLSQDRTSVDAKANGGSLTVTFDDRNFTVPAGQFARFQMLSSSGQCRLQIGGETKAYDATCWANIKRGSGAVTTLSNETVAYGRGRILLRPRGNDPKVFHVVAELPNVDEYLIGLREVPSSWPTHALRAQAIAGRSYASYDLLGGGVNANACQCHLYDSVKSQVYGGTTGETTAWRNAVTDTAGQVVWAPGATGTRGGGVVQAFYSSSSGGRTEAIEDSTAFSSGPRPYFSSVDDPWSLRSSNPYASWVIDVPESAVRTKLGFDDVLSISVTARNESGSARTVAFTGRRGSSTVTTTTTGDQLRGLLGLRSGYIASVFLPPFIDDDGNVHEASIAWLAAEKITSGCNPPTNNRFCPNDAVTRAQMATFLTNALNLTPQSENFSDVPADHTHAKSIGAIAAAGITSGCNPPKNDRFCPDQAVTRAQMATFLTNALNLRPQAEKFVDVPNDSTHAKSIGAIAARGITNGCNPPTNDRYCPNDAVTRAQMATFIKNART